MKKLNLKELVRLLDQEPERQYVVAVIDNAPPGKPSLPLIEENFIWVPKMDSLPMSRERVSQLFQNYGVEVGGGQEAIAVFHHHDLKKPYEEWEGVEYYEFSHGGRFAYQCFEHADSKLLSHMLSRSFHQDEQVILVKADIPQEEIEKLQGQCWFLHLSDSEREEMQEKGVDIESFLLYRLALEMGPGSVVPDPKRYRPEVHDELLKSGVPVDMYAIPSLFPKVLIRTDAEMLDAEIRRKVFTREADWQQTVEQLRQQREAELARIAEEERQRARGELVAEDVRQYIASIAPSLGYDYTDNPVFPEGRKDICAVRHSAENGSSYGFDTIYLVWRAESGEMGVRELINSRATKDYIHVRGLREKNGKIVVEVGSGGSYSGSPWDKSIEVAISELSDVAGQLKPKDEIERLEEGISVMASRLPDSVRPFLEAMERQMARFARAKAGMQTEGEKRLAEHQDHLERILAKHPDIKTFRLATIAEVYPEKLFKRTFSLLDSVDDHAVAQEAVHILGEMAMMANHPSLYERMLKLLEEADDTRRHQILQDDRFEFVSDEWLEDALREYESQ